MLVHYLTLGDGNEISHTLAKDNESVTVYFEKADEIYGFKTAKISIPEIVIKSRSGFDDDEMRNLVHFTESNMSIIYRYAQSGGIGGTLNA